MSSVNKVILVGRLGTDPESKSFGTGQPMTRLNLATSEVWVDKMGQKQERTEWHRVVVWGKQAENCSKYLSKGRSIYVEGRLQTRSWDDPQGQKRYTTEIVAQNIQFLSGGAGDRASTHSGIPSGGASDSMPQDYGPEPTFDPSEEMPF